MKPIYVYLHKHIMKNTVYIEYDDSKEFPITIGKPPEIPAPNNHEEAGKMLIDDINTICDALKTLIDIAKKSGYVEDDEKLIGECVERIKQ